jgi:hypothetical protein
MRIKFLSLLLLFSVFSRAQNFTHSLSIVSKKNGLQALALGTEIRNIANTSLNDVRLYDSKNTEVPYFLVNESFTYSSSKFKEHEMLNKEVGKGRYTRFTIVNKEKDKIGYVILSIANSDAWKLCDITGSDDGMQWFSVSDHIFLYSLYDMDKTNTFRSIHFPPADYKYIKFEINDLYTKPLNILKAGYFEGSINAGKLNRVTPSSTKQTEDKVKKLSTVAITFPQSTLMDKISFTVKAPNLYKRNATIYVNRSRESKGKTESYRENLLSFELNSDYGNQFELYNFREKEFFIEVENQDNPPLEFDKIKLEQLQSYLVADFKNEESYTLMAGNKKLSQPVYDIENFRSKISQYLPTLKVGMFKEIPQKAVEVKVEDKKIWDESWFMWLCIGAASVLLFFFSASMLKSMKGK